ncbi:unnamed protein product [Leuciscus chuanchicus]
MSSFSFLLTLADVTSDLLESLRGYSRCSDIINSPAPNTLTSHVISRPHSTHSVNSGSRVSPPAIAPAFGNVSSSVSEDGALISWEYWGPEKHLYVEYIIDNSDEDWHTEKVNGSQFHVLKGLKEGLSYKVRVVAGGREDERSLRRSEELLVTLPAMVSPQVDIATQGWFIGLMSAIALLILILLIVCFIKRNKGGKYPVKEKEDAHGDPEIQPMKEDDITFGEYSEEDRKPLRVSPTPSSGTVPRDGSEDSLVEYADSGDTQFNEDGSFIGQYSGRSGPPSPVINSLV